MKSLISFTKKEFLEHFRSAKIYILAGVFILFALMNPIVAKITPELMSMFSESMQGIEITSIEVSAMDSWLQFFKNIPIALIVFVILESNIFTKEYQKGTLVLALTKGLKRHNVLISKAFVMLTLWSIGYYMCYGLTYLFNDILWDNSTMSNLGFSVFCWWLMGVMAICLTVFFSAIAKSNVAVLVGTGGVVFGSYLVGMLPKIDKYMPTYIMTPAFNAESLGNYVPSVIIASVISVAAIIISIPVFNKKHI